MKCTIKKRIDRIKNYFVVINVIIVFISCQNNNVRLKGHLTGGTSKWLYIEKVTPREIVLIDSVKVDQDENFILQTEIDNQAFLRMRNDLGEVVFLIVYPGDKIIIEGNYYDFSSTYKLNGSFESDLLRDYMKQFNYALHEKRKIADSFYLRTSRGEDFEKVRNELIEKHDQIKKEIRSYTIEFIEKNKCSLASVFIFDLQLGPKDPVLKMEEDYRYYAMVDSCLSSRFPENEIVQAYNKSLIIFNQNKKNRNALNNAIGSKAPEIALPDPKGDTVTLTSLKGKYILLDFWASWNTQCRNNNLQLVKIYNRYHIKGFEIYQVSLDKSKESWIKAIETDQLPWIQVSDLQFWDSYVTDLYNVYSIPANFLIQPDGKIIDINLETDQLQTRLQEIFNK